MLSPRHQRFCQEYALGHNATQAYIRAGYSKKGAAQSAERLLRKAEIRSEVDRCLKEQEAIRQRTVEVTVAEVVNGLKEHATKGSTRAWELLGKHIGMWSEQAQTAEDAFADVVEAADGEPAAEG